MHGWFLLPRHAAIVGVLSPAPAELDGGVHARLERSLARLRGGEAAGGATDALAELLLPLVSAADDPDETP